MQCLRNTACNRGYSCSVYSDENTYLTFKRSVKVESNTSGDFTAICKQSAKHLKFTLENFTFPENVFDIRG